MATFFTVLTVVTSLAMVAVWTEPAPTVQAQEPAVQQAQELSRAFRWAAKQVLPTVVKIQTETRAHRVSQSLQRSNPYQGTPFEDFFDADDGDRPTPRAMPSHRGVGSGVIIDPSGVILTNNHVLEGADKVIVQLADGRRFEGADIKVDPQTDLAVLRIKANAPLPAARLGNSDKLEIGDWVLAMGSPFELDQTVSAGIISAKGRPLGGPRTQYLQTDAAINPGNSGGPLVALDGTVVGINTAIASQTGAYEGIGFAIPSNVAQWVTSQLVENGSVKRAYLGVGIEALTPELADQLGVPAQHGVIVTDVCDKTPAAQAGLKAGDVIVAFAGREVRDPGQLQQAVERAPLGSRQEVRTFRGSTPQAYSVAVQNLPKDFSLVSRDLPSGQFRMAPTEVSDSQLGVAVADLTAKNADPDASRVVITQIDPEGVAAQAGLREGMMILRVGKTPIRTAADFKAAMGNVSLTDGVLLLVRTREGNRFVVVKSP